MSLDYALRADITVHEVEYDYGLGTVQYEVHEDAEGKYRAVVAGAYDEDGSRIDYEVDGIRLYPSWTERVRERLGLGEWTAEPEYRQVARVTDEMESAIDRVERARSRHSDSLCEVRTEAQG